MIAPGSVGSFSSMKLSERSSWSLSCRGGSTLPMIRYSPIVRLPSGSAVPPTVTPSADLKWPLSPPSACAFRSLAECSSPARRCSRTTGDVLKPAAVSVEVGVLGAGAADDAAPSSCAAVGAALAALASALFASVLAPAASLSASLAAWRAAARTYLGCTGIRGSVRASSGCLCPRPWLAASRSACSTERKCAASRRKIVSTASPCL